VTGVAAGSDRPADGDPIRPGPADRDPVRPAPADRDPVRPAHADRVVDRDRLGALTAREAARFAAAHPRCAAMHQRSRRTMPGGVPMSWMAKWAGGFPIAAAEAAGAHVLCLDGIDHVDLCLGDTGAMAGHSPAPTVRAVAAQAARGITTMLPGEDAAAVADELGRRFGLPAWQFTLSATDANRHVLRYARHLTGRPKVAVVDYCYHGSVDEAFATLDGTGAVVARRGNLGPPVPPGQTTVVVPFNDVAALERALAGGDVACLLAEPAMTNIGIVLPEPGWHDAARALTRAAGTLLVLDETHTLCAGPGGATGADGLVPDLLVIGKAIGGGVPVGAFGMTAELAARIPASVELEDVDLGGIGGTLAGNPLSLAATRATLTEVLTDAVFARMIELGRRWEAGVADVLARFDLPWHVTRLGCRAEYGFTAEPPRDGAAAAAADDFALQTYLHLHALTRGVLLTPFHNMALTCPATTEADVDRHTEAFAAAAADLTG
jgi:glutamate-1-semialdehyde 2,1-aminomutase